ncbi:choice-of-anchor D domain-containing protein [Aerosakkonemataceae cyanobacterium BLCC-F50]|uniref:Choice-of-anchor D domain-containing protein n=1 Tax=Floridaenema flaviceps BLCC-F50 TaxID=3153642 RepID=A0ABV4Y2H1_9CYAN
MAISQAAIDNKLIIGTPAPDSIAGLENTDTILGAESADILIANQDLDMINGNQGSDTIRGSQSAEMLRGGQNNDFITGDNGQDTILGDLGSDTLIGDRGDDVIYGAPYEDVDFAGDGKDFLYGGQGKDTLFGGADNDLVAGNEESDILYGNKGNDTIYGGQSNDTIYGGQENDQLFGDKANDVLWGDLGADTLTGGIGDDVFVIGRRNDVDGFQSTGGSTIAQADVITDFGKGLDLIALTGELTFDNLNIVQGTGENAANTLIQDKSTGQYLANLQGVDLNTITKADFTYSTISINNYLSFAQPTYSVTEEGTPGLAVTINRTGEINQAVSATLFTSDGTAKSPTDYNGNPIAVDFAPGQTSRTVTIPIVGDNIAEGQETFDLSLGFPFNGATVEQPQKATVTIVDNDNGGGNNNNGGSNGGGVSAAEAGTIQFSSPTFAVNEDGTPVASVTVNRNGNSNGAVSAKLLINGGTAIGGSSPLASPVDYDNSFITVEWEDGDNTPKTIDIPITDDALTEGNETVNLTLCDCTGGATIGKQDTTVLTIVDNEGVSSSTLNPEIDLFVGGTGIPDNTGSVDFGSAAVGDDLTKTFTIQNTSPTDTLNINSWEIPDGYCLVGNVPGSVDPNSKATFTLSVDTTKAGNRQGVISINNNDRNESPFNFAVKAAIGDNTTPSPTESAIQIFNDGSEVSDDSTSAIDFGTVNLGGTLSHTFTIKNTSSQKALTLSDLTLPDGFSLVGTFPNSIAPNTEKTITINVDTSTVANPQGTLSFKTSDSSDNPFNFNIQATVNQGTSSPSPQGGEIEVLDNGVDISDGSSNPLDFGTAKVGDNLSKTFTIKNTSTQGTLTLSDLSLPSGFTLVGNLPNSIAPNSEKTITINVDTSTVAKPDGTLSFKTSDSDENPFNFNIKATVNQGTSSPSSQGGEIEVLDQGIFNLTDGSPIPVDFGTAKVGDNLSKIFTIKNTSTQGTLTLSDLSLPSGFSLAGTFPDSIAPNSEKTITINVDTSKVANPDGTLSFKTSDSDENPFNFGIKATVNEATSSNGGGTIEVLDGGSEITDGSTNVFDLGIVDVGQSLSKTFTIKNVSNSQDLVLSNLTLPDGFNLQGDFPSTIAPNSTATFSINVNTTTVTDLQGTLSFKTNDPNQNPFDFVIGATVRNPAAPVEILGSEGRDRIQGDDNGVDIITPRGGADIITWTNVPPQGITDQIIGFAPNEDKLQFAVANFGGISSITPVTVTQLSADGTNISGKNLVLFDNSLSFSDIAAVDSALAAQNGSSGSATYFVYSASGVQYLGFDPIANQTGDATNIVKLDAAPTAESFSFFN